MTPQAFNGSEVCSWVQAHLHMKPASDRSIFINPQQTLKHKSLHQTVEEIRRTGLNIEHRILILTK